VAKEKIPSTQAIRTLKEHGIKFIPRPYKYEEKGGRVCLLKCLHQNW